MPNRCSPSRKAYLVLGEGLRAEVRLRVRVMWMCTCFLCKYEYDLTRLLKMHLRCTY